MKKLAILFIFILTIMFTACSSVESDAKKAAELEKESLLYAKEQDLEEAEKLYKQAQEIINRYKGSDKSGEFHAIFNRYMQDIENR